MFLYMHAGQHSGISSSNPRGWDSHAEQFLQPLGLEIYVQAFQVAGFDTDKQFKGLVAEDLDHVQRLSHIPILPGHRQKILDAARCYKPAVRAQACAYFDCQQESQNFSSAAVTVCITHYSYPPVLNLLSCLCCMLLLKGCWHPRSGI